MLGSYFSYRVKAKGRQSIHSPFLFEFYNDIVKFKGNKETQNCDHMLRENLKSEVLIDAGGFGAGSRKKNKPRKVSSIAKLSGSSARWGRFLFAMSERFGGDVVIELGTNLGIGTSYLALGNKNTTVHTFEGNSSLYDFSSANFEKNGISNVQAHLGLIQDLLPGVLSDVKKVDLVYIDADHTYEATVHFFELLKPHLKESSVIIFDDIHWSEGMESAWQEVVSDSMVTLSLDLFFKGIVFFDKGLSKEHFILKH